MEKVNDLANESGSDYEGASIVNIRRGKGARSKYIYAQIRDKNGVVRVQADLDYCVAAMKERLPK